MATYRVLAGMHAEGRGKERRTYPKGAYVVSKVDLERRFGSRKFRLISNDDLEDSVAKANDPFRAPRPPKPINDGLDAMNAKQLRELAENDEIDVSNCKTKTELIAAIRASN